MIELTSDEWPDMLSWPQVSPTIMDMYHEQERLGLVRELTSEESLHGVQALYWMEHSYYKMRGVYRHWRDVTSDPDELKLFCEGSVAWIRAKAIYQESQEKFAHYAEKDNVLETIRDEGGFIKYHKNILDLGREFAFTTSGMQIMWLEMDRIHDTIGMTYTLIPSEEEDVGTILHRMNDDAMKVIALAPQKEEALQRKWSKFQEEAAKA